MKTHYCPADKTTISYEGECNWCGERELNRDVFNKAIWDTILYKELRDWDDIAVDRLYEFANIIYNVGRDGK